MPPAHDANGKRTSKQTANGIQYYVWDGDQLAVTISPSIDPLYEITLPSTGHKEGVVVPIQYGTVYYAKVNGIVYSVEAEFDNGQAGLLRARPDDDDEIPVTPPDPVVDTYTVLEFGDVTIRVANRTQAGAITGPAGADIELYTHDPSSALPTVSYVRGLSLVAAVQDEVPTYYHYNAHGDVVQLTNSSGTVTKDYTYDAFGVEKNASASDANPFRYCGEQFDTETGNYYLRARYYSPGVGRFTQEDTHWNSGNMVYGDEPQKWNEWQGEEDTLGLHAYTYRPQTTAIAQSGNGYVYSLGNPILYVDENGEWVHILIGAAMGGVAGGIINAASQLLRNGKVDWGEVAINAAGGAVGGALTAAGLGPVASVVSSAVTSGATNALTQAYHNNWDFRKINVASVLTDAAIGAFGAKVGGKAGNTRHLDSMGQRLMTRIGNALGGKVLSSTSARKAAAQEVMNALKYYASQSSKDNVKVIQSVLKSQLPWLGKMGYDVYSVKAGK